jgi:hypothetical protein
MPRPHIAFDLRLSRRTVVGEPPADCRHDEADVLSTRRISVLDRSSQQIRASGFASIKASGAPLTSRQCRQGLADLLDRAGARQAKESTGPAPVCTRAVMPGLGRSASLCRRCPDSDSPLTLVSRLLVLRHLQDVVDGPATTCNARGRMDPDIASPDRVRDGGFTYIEAFQYVDGIPTASAKGCRPTSVRDRDMRAGPGRIR